LELVVEDEGKGGGNPENNCGEVIDSLCQRLQSRHHLRKAGLGYRDGSGLCRRVAEDDGVGGAHTWGRSGLSRIVAGVGVDTGHCNWVEVGSRNYDRVEVGTMDSGCDRIDTVDDHGVRVYFCRPGRGRSVSVYDTTTCECAAGLAHLGYAVDSTLLTTSGGAGDHGEKDGREKREDW
jgi:hypothetical protein